MESLQFYLDRIQRQIDRDRANCQQKGYQFKERQAESSNVRMGDLLDAIGSIDNEADARQFFAGYVAWLQALPPELQEPNCRMEDVARANIGWCFGEGMAPERRQMWRTACNASHPVFGAMTSDPTPTEAFEAGLARGKALRE